jgi:beta-lactam-binding protein with PASTA domain
MRRCPTCTHENPDSVDFCEGCGAYVRWEESGAVRVSAPAPPVAEPARREETKPYAAAPARRALLTLSLPGVDTPAGQAVTAYAEPGGEVVLLASLRNESAIVEIYELSVAGIPDDWWTIVPPTVHLLPFQRDVAGSEREVEVRFRPPRTPQAEARAWPFEVVATRRTDGARVASAPGTLVVAPYRDLRSEMRPQRKAGRLRARFAVASRNRGNAPAELRYSATDSREACRFAFETGHVLAAPGHSAGSVVWVRPRKQIWLGRPVEHVFTISTGVAGSDLSAPPQTGVFVQKPWLPRWLPVALAGAAAVAAAVLFLLPERTTVPDLAGTKDLFVARQRLERSGLKLGRTTTTVAPDEVGRIVHQSPAPGTEVDRGSAVSIELAVGSGVHAVPKITGLTLPEADELLRERGFQIGSAHPKAPSDLDDVIDGQAPAAGAPAHEGSGIDVFFSPVDTGPRQPVVPPRGDLKVPDLSKAVGQSALVAAATDADLTPNPILRFDADVRSGHLIEQRPAAGTKTRKGATVTLVISAGYPRIAFDASGDVFVAGAAHGDGLKGVAVTRDDESQPSWSPDGRLLAYRRGTFERGEIWVLDPANPHSAAPLTHDGIDARRPAFSPDGKVVAFVRGAVHTADPSDWEDDDLCFVSVAKPGPTSCIRDPDTTLSRPSWAPDGRAILVVAKAKADPRHTDLLEYASATASSGDEADWSSRGFVTRALHTPRAGDAVREAAWSPDGGRIAFTANWDRGIPVLFLVATKGERPDPDPKSVVRLGRVRGCELAWRSDGRELAVVQRDGQCAGPGIVARLDPDRPPDLTLLTDAALGANNPAWSPFAPGG